MSTLAAIREAAFWRDYICLDCSARNEDSGPEELELTAICPECGGTMRRATVLLEIWDKIEPEE